VLIVLTLLVWWRPVRSRVGSEARGSGASAIQVVHHWKQFSMVGALTLTRWYAGFVDTDVSRAGRDMAVEQRKAPRFLRRPSLPPQGNRLLWSYSVLVAPAVLAAVFAWLWWIGVVLLVPGLLLRLRAGWAVAEARGIASCDQTGQVVVSAISGLGAVALGAVARTFPGQYSALFFACYVIIVVDPLWRIFYHWLASRNARMAAAAQSSTPNA